MAKPAKVSTVAEIADSFRNSTAAVVTEYRGLTMAQLTELRRSLGRDTAYTVAKNTLVKRAASDAGVQGLDDLFTGPTAVAFISGEPVDAAKVLRDFAKAHPLLVIKGGLLDGKSVSPGEVNKLADLESRDVLLAKMAGAMKGTLTKAAVLFNQLPSQVVRLAAALLEKRTAEAPVAAAPAAETSADEAPAAEAPADEAPTDAASVAESAAAEAPADEAPAAEAPADEAPTDAVPVAESAAAEAPADESAADATPEVASPEAVSLEAVSPEAEAPADAAPTEEQADQA